MNEEVWVVKTHHGHGEGAGVHGVYKGRQVNPLRAFAQAVLSGAVAADDETTEALRQAEEIESRRDATQGQ